jgi:hypothetical protein
MSVDAVNIGPNETRRRRLIGIVMLVAGVAAAVFFVVAGVGRPWRLLLFLPFWMAGFGLLQARAKT